MITTAITDKYVTDIPWELNPTFAFNDTEAQYKEAFENVIEYVPDTENKICFNDEVWDFNPYYKDINDDSYVMRFALADDDYVNQLKFFAIYSIGRKSKISTAERRIGDFIDIIQSIKNNTNHKSFSLISTEDVIECIEERDVGNSRKHSLFACAHIIYDFIVKNYKCELPVEIDVLKEKSAFYKKKAKQEDEKRKNIPEELYNAILNKAIEVLNDDTAPYSERATAAMIIILTQTALRPQDLLGIKVDDLKEKYLPVSKVKCHYLHFQTRKPSKAHSDMLEFDIYASELCSEAFNKLLELRKQCEFSYQPYLYVLPDAINALNTYPMLDSRFMLEYKNFLYKYLYNEISKEWKGIDKVQYEIYNKETKQRDKYYYSTPKLSQYRVHLATALYNNGISLVYIQKYLGHLSEYMLGYYVRPNATFQEDTEYAERIVKKIAGDDITPLGHMGKELKDNLKKFIAAGNYNVQTDIKAVIEDLGEKLVIREKGPGLCCIKTSIIPCKNDARTNEILCAYGMCPNIFHFYDMIDVSYMQFHALQDSYQENLNNGFEKAAQKELNKLKDFIRRRLKTEFNEFEKVVKEKGVKKFCEKHPDLKHMAIKVNEIKEEIKLWENI